MNVDIKARENPDLVITVTWNEAIELAAYLSLAPGQPSCVPYRLRSMIGNRINLAYGPITDTFMKYRGIYRKGWDSK